MKFWPGNCHRPLLMIYQYWLWQWLGAIRQQAITWANADLDLWRHMVQHCVLLRLNELTQNLMPIESLIAFWKHHSWNNRHWIGLHWFNDKDVANILCLETVWRNDWISNLSWISMCETKRCICFQISDTTPSHIISSSRCNTYHIPRRKRICAFLCVRVYSIY